LFSVYRFLAMTFRHKAHNHIVLEVLSSFYCSLLPIIIHVTGLAATTNHTAKVGTSVKFYFQCMSKGGATCPDTRWYYYKQDSSQPHLLYNGNQLRPGYDASRFKINKSSSFSELIITELHIKDSGTYGCGPGSSLPTRFFHLRVLYGKIKC